LNKKQIKTSKKFEESEGKKPNFEKVAGNFLEFVFVKDSKQICEIPKAKDEEILKLRFSCILGNYRKEQTKSIRSHAQRIGTKMKNP
jgi:hypothetical protein